MRILNRYLIALKSHVLRLGLFGALSGCLTPIDVDVANTSGIVVISGQVSNLADQTVIQLGLTADTDRLPFPVSAAVVRIIDESAGDTIRLLESTKTPGFYYPASYSGVPGHAYHVEVEFPQRGTYRSGTDVMPALPGTLQSHYEFITQSYTDLEGIVSEQPFVFTYIDTQVPESSEKVYLRWSVDEVFLLSPTDFPDPFGSIPPPCLVAQNADPQRVVLYDGSKVGVRTFENMLVATRIVDWSFLEKHAFTTYQSSLSAAAHEYWTKVDILSNQTGSIFDTPPAALTGNLHRDNSDERIFGFFQAVAQNYDRYFIYNSDVPFPLNAADCQYFGDRTNYPTRCLDCQSIRNASYDRPDWF